MVTKNCQKNLQFLLNFLKKLLKQNNYLKSLTAFDVVLFGDWVGHCFEFVACFFGVALFAMLDFGVFLGTSVTLFLLLTDPGIMIVFFVLDSLCSSYLSTLSTG